MISKNIRCDMMENFRKNCDASTPVDVSTERSVECPVDVLKLDPNRATLKVYFITYASSLTSNITFVWNVALHSSLEEASLRLLVLHKER